MIVASFTEHEIPVVEELPVSCGAGLLPQICSNLGNNCQDCRIDISKPRSEGSIIVEIACSVAFRKQMALTPHNQPSAGFLRQNIHILVQPRQQPLRRVVDRSAPRNDTVELHRLEPIPIQSAGGERANKEDSCTTALIATANPTRGAREKAPTYTLVTRERESAISKIDKISIDTPTRRFHIPRDSRLPICKRLTCLRKQLNKRPVVDQEFVVGEVREVQEHGHGSFDLK